MTATELNNEAVKNQCFYDATEKIRYANMQKTGLNNKAAYHTHLKKIMKELHDDISKILELGSVGFELDPIIEKYVEFVQELNMDEFWDDYRDLCKYEAFSAYTGQ